MIKCTAGDVQVEQDSTGRAAHAGVVAPKGHQTTGEVECLNPRVAALTQQSCVRVKLVAWELSYRVGFVGSFAHDDVEHLYQVLVTSVMGLGGR